jgi:hypothetical protein
MNDNSNKIEGKLIESLEAKELGSLTIDYVELGLDSILDDGIIKDIPILRTAVSLVKIGLNVRDRIYVKKIYCFLAQVGQTTQEQREKFIKDNCQNVKQFEEAVLLILEQADNMNKSALIGKIFKACILGNISYQDALSLSSIVNKALWQDLENMLNLTLTIEMKMRLCNCGLLNLGLMRRHHYDQTKPTETKETIDGFGYHENQYYKMLLEIAKL